MRTTRVLAIAAILGIAFSFRASAKVAYDSETTNVWFTVQAANPGDFSNAPWTKPSKGGDVSVVDSKIALDTDLDDPLIYTPTSATGPVVIVTAQYTATANADAPNLADTPQAALAVIANGADTNWWGLVKKSESVAWEKFENVRPSVGETYKIHIDLNNVTHQIRYWVGDTILGTGWYDNPKSESETQVTSVSFVGTGDIGNFGGDNITENGATYKGMGYETFDAALAVAQDDWMNQGTEAIVLYQPATYTVNNSGTIYVNANGRAFTISGGVYEQNGNTYVITANNDCEAKIGSTFYSTIEKAITAATAGQTIIVNKALNKALTFNNTSVTLDTNSKTVTCATLTVAEGVTLTLDDALAVTTATIDGAVAGETLTVNGTLTGVNVAKLTFGNAATFAYAGTKLAPTALTIGTALTITGLGEAAIGTEVITATGLDASKITATLPEGRCLEVIDNTLTVVREILATITASSETEGFDYTNGTVSVTANVRDGKTATAVLTVIGWDGTTKEVAARDVTSGTALTWDVAAAMEGALVQGGAYTYTVEVKVDDKVAAVKSGEFTAAKWGADGAWFIADATADPVMVDGGSWESTPDIAGGKYAVSDSKFNVMSETGSNKFTRVDTKVAFESLVDDTPDTPEDAAVGGFVAATQGWMALDNGSWALLAGAPNPVVGNEYVIRTEFDFAATSKRMRFFVAEVVDNVVGDFAPLAKEGGSQWLATGIADQETLKAVEFQGSGALASIKATVADKALFEVNGKKFDTMEEALKEAGTNGTNKITLLTNATINPEKAGKYEIVAGKYHYVSGGKDSSGNRTIIVDKPGEPPVVRPTDAEMQKVLTPDGNSYKSYDSLRKFLEKNKVAGYTNDTADAVSVSNALMKTAENTLLLWQDYALGIDKNTSVAPVTTPAGDTNPNAITLAIPTIDTSKYSGDYTISYQVMKGSEPVPSGEGGNPGAILIPLTSGTGTYTIKAVFTAE